MKVQVRNGVFETNSSSTHAISVCAFDINKHEIPETVVFETDSNNFLEITMTLNSNNPQIPMDATSMDIPV